MPKYYKIPKEKKKKTTVVRKKVFYNVREVVKRNIPNAYKGYEELLDMSSNNMDEDEKSKEIINENFNKNKFKNIISNEDDTEDIKINDDNINIISEKESENIITNEEEICTDAIKKKDEKDKNIIILHSSRGKKLAAGNINVIEFEVGGTSYNMPTRNYKGVNTKEGIIIEKESKDCYSFKNQYNATDKLKKNELANKTEEIYKEIYGNTITINEETYNGIRKKEDNNKVRYSFTGPNLFNSGKYEIDNTRVYIFNLGMDYLNSIEKEIIAGKQVKLMFSGHSRGAVAAIQGAMMLKNFINLKYGKSSENISIETILYDPVPGGSGLRKAEIRDSVDIRKLSLEMKKPVLTVNMAHDKTEEPVPISMSPFGPNDKCTVFYSIDPDHRAFFQPQKIVGANKVIVTPKIHSSGLIEEEIQYEVRRKKAYICAENKQAYRGSGITELPDGCYICDEDNVLVHIDKTEDLEKIMSQARKSWFERDTRNVGKRDRRRKILEAANSAIVGENGIVSLNSIIRGFNTHSEWKTTEYNAIEDDFRQYVSFCDNDIKFAMEKKAKILKNTERYLSLRIGKDNLTCAKLNRIEDAKNIMRYFGCNRNEDIVKFVENKEKARSDIGKYLKKNIVERTINENKVYKSLAKKMLILYLSKDNEPYDFFDRKFFSQTLKYIIANNIYCDLLQKDTRLITSNVLRDINATANNMINGISEKKLSEFMVCMKKIFSKDVSSIGCNSDKINNYIEEFTSNENLYTELPCKGKNNEESLSMDITLKRACIKNKVTGKGSLTEKNKKTITNNNDINNSSYYKG